MLIDRSGKSMTTEMPLWMPSAERVAATRMTAFTNWLAEREGASFADYGALHAWSVANINRKSVV